MRVILALLLIVLSLPVGKAQRTLNISLLSDAAQGDNSNFENSIKREIKSLFTSDYQINITEFFTSGDPFLAQQQLEEIYAQQKADVLIGTGIISSYQLAKRSNYPIPTIAAIHLDSRLTGDSTAIPSTSNISNYTFVESPFNIEKDIKTLLEISKSTQMAILVDPALNKVGIDLSAILALAVGVQLELIEIDPDPAITLNAISPNTDAVYILSPLSQYSEIQGRQFFDGLIEKRLPSFSILDRPTLNYGGYAAFSSSENLQRIPRRIALNVERIVEGKDPKDFPVKMESYADHLIINMETVNKIKKYPSWAVLDRALLLNINKNDSDKLITLKSVIAEGLQNNLAYQIEQKQTELSKQDVVAAKNNYLPQLEVESTGLFLDQNSVDASFGSKGSFNWSASAAFSQLLLSEPALANIAIQKLLQESQNQEQRQVGLDVILDLSTGYFSYLQLLSVTELQNDNIKAKNENLKIAITKEKVGYSGQSDIYRLETELALAKVDFNEANAQLRSARFQLNQLRNRPIDEEFVVDDLELFKRIPDESELDFVPLIEDAGVLQTFADFMVMEAKNQLPQAKQIELAISAQDRLLKSNKRAFYIPSISFGANYDYPISIVNPGDALPIPGVEPAINPTWNAAFIARHPIFAGGFRKVEKEKAQLKLQQLHDQRGDVTNLLELQIRANLEKLNASYNNLNLTKKAAESARKNITIIQNLYREGQVNVITLIDAQNALLGSEINATNAIYQFMIDLYAFQHSTGFYFSLAEESQRSALLERFIQFKTK